jgi:hypothetical protein
LTGVLYSSSAMSALWHYHAWSFRSKHVWPHHNYSTCSYAVYALS